MEFITQFLDAKNRIQTFRAEHKDGACFQVELGFGTNRHDLNRAQVSTVLGSLKFLKEEDMILEMYGEADPQGEPGYNMMLSEKRMRTVQRLMVHHGVPREKVFVPALCKALGEFFANSQRMPEKDPVGRAVHYFLWRGFDSFKDGLTTRAGPLLTFGRAFPVSG